MWSISVAKFLHRPGCGGVQKKGLQIHPMVLTSYLLSSLLSQSRHTHRLPEGLLLVIGNPLLDISACVGEDLLRKYKLKPNDAIVAEKKHLPLFQELMEKYKPQFTAGGSEQNSVRVVQWILKKPKVCTYIGCVGDDNYGKILREKATADGVDVQYQVTNEAPTGTCAVLLNNMQRSLVANLGAAEKFIPEYLAMKECRESYQAAKFFYSSGFFLAVSPESVMQLATHAHRNKHRFIFNISAPFVAENYIEHLKKILYYVDILFGNETEIKACGKALQINKMDVKDIAVKISQLPQGTKVASPRTVVITQSSDPIILVQNGGVTYIPVPTLTKEEMVDTNGAGDAFAGGFLSQLILNKPNETCIEAGIYAARNIIQHSGCTFTSESDF